MGFTKEINWWAQQEQSILSWVRKRRVGAALAQRLKGMREASAPMRCGKSFREATRVQLGGPGLPRIMRTALGVPTLWRGMTRQRERPRNTTC